jgi:hypothetical protein
MTLDERLERLADRHEALTQSVELLVHSQRKNEEMLTHVIESIDSLARIAHLHEQRLPDLEGPAS